MTRSPSSVIPLWVRARPSWATRSGPLWRSSESPPAGSGRLPRWLPVVTLIVAAVAAPCAAQQAERARQLQKTHREALQVQQQFQERVRAGKLDEAYELSRKCEALQREL